MYANRRNVKDIILKLRFSDLEMEQIDCLTAKTGQQKAALVRKLLMAQVSEELAKTEGPQIAHQ